MVSSGQCGVSAAVVEGRPTVVVTAADPVVLSSDCCVDEYEFDAGVVVPDGELEVRAVSL